MMLTLYSARECIDKEKFIYEKIGRSERESLVLVPNQYTLVAEEQAVRYLGKGCLFDTEILSMNRLGHRILAEKGLESVQMLSRYGRLMLLTRIVAEHEEELELFAKSARKISFAQMLDDFVVSFKQQNCTLEELEAMLEDENSNVILKQKIKELSGILEDYEQAIAGKYTDSEDYINMYIDAIPECRIAKGKDIWIYGYDSITPKFTRAMLELAKRAESVNLIINENDYGLDQRVKAAIRAKAAEAGVSVGEERISDEYLKVKSEALSRIEKHLCETVVSDEVLAANSDFQPDGVELVQCANQYYEAENAAAYIHRLIREEEYSLSDITVICNSEDRLQPIVKRALQEYGIPVFLDTAREITDSPGPVFLFNLLLCLRYEFNNNAIFAMLKTGYAGISAEEIDDLENYAREYNIRGTMWTRDFKYGSHSFGEEELARLNEIRARVAAPIVKLRELAKNSADTGAFTTAFAAFLESEYELSVNNEKRAVDQEKMELFEDAQRTRRSLEEALELLNQIKEIMADCPLDIAEFTDLYAVGLKSEKIGVIPPSLDGLSMGTLIRTRPRPNRAVLILGANEGILPLRPAAEGLFSVDEKSYFKRMDFTLGELDELKMTEENAALYRMLSHPSERLYVSYSLSDTEGKELIPSTLVDSLKAFFPKLEARKDIISDGWDMSLVSDRREALRHLINHIKDRNTPAKGDELTKALLAWYKAKAPELLMPMLETAQDENEQKKLGVQLSKGIYAEASGSYKLGASKINKYNDCPFGYFVSYGLSPREERNYSSDPRSIGEIYHECMEEVARVAMQCKKDKKELKDSELAKLVEDKIYELAGNFEGGLFVSTSAEIFHMDRICEVCQAAAKALAVQIESGAVEEVFLEADFGRGDSCRFRPIEIEVGDEKVYVEGRIDRADMMEGGSVRIIDYKTGTDKVDVGKMRQGYKMQLMIYLMSSLQDGYEPAGIFYFNIAENTANLSKATASKQKSVMNAQPQDSYKLKGKYVDTPGMLERMPKAVMSGKELKLSGDEFDELKSAVRQKMEDISSAIVGGDISISPLRSKNTLISCRYCEYKAICRYDSANAGNRSRELK